jgi:predicted branched-subunit amino acid permease
VAASGERTFAFLLGAELSLFAGWNLATFGGAIAGSAIADPAELGIDLVFPLAFLALLEPLVRPRVEHLDAVASGAIAYVAGRGLPGGLPILLAGVVGSLVGAALTSGRPDDEPDLEAAVREVA